MRNDIWKMFLLRNARDHFLSMNLKLCKRLFLVLIAFGICAPTVSARTPNTHERNIFVFHTDEFWLNLHHFLYVLGRADNKETDTAREAVSGAPADQDGGLRKLNAKEQKIWREAVASYAAGVSKRDIVFDSPMPAVTTALARAGDSKTLTGVKSIQGSRRFCSAPHQFIGKPGGKNITKQTSAGRRP